MTMTKKNKKKGSVEAMLVKDRSRLRIKLVNIEQHIAHLERNRTDVEFKLKRTTELLDTMYGRPQFRYDQ